MMVRQPPTRCSPTRSCRTRRKELRARNLSRELRCMVCQNQSIDDSDAPLARDLRLLVRERIAAGDSDAQVLDFLVARYGEFVLLKPRLEPRTWLLWLLSPLALAGGGLALWDSGAAALQIRRAGQFDGQTDGGRRGAVGKTDHRNVIAGPICIALQRALFAAVRSHFFPAINCRIGLRLHYKSLIPSPARCKAAVPIFRRQGCLRRGTVFSGLWRLSK